MHRSLIILFTSVGLLSSCASNSQVGTKIRTIDFDEAMAFERMLEANAVSKPQSYAPVTIFKVTFLTLVPGIALGIVSKAKALLVTNCHSARPRSKPVGTHLFDMAESGSSGLSLSRWTQI